VDASQEYLDRDLVLDELRELRWRNRFSYDSQDLPFKGEARRCYVLFLKDTSCYPQLGYPSFANFVLQNTFQLRRVLDDQGKVDYELPIFNYATTDKLSAPFLGFADDDYRTGTQSYVFNFISPGIAEAGYGLTTTMIHEVGHHLAMSHPHDGYDSQRGIDYGPADRFFFAWAGDEHNSMMSYIDLNWDFSQFDRDNSDRFLTATYVEAANRLAAEVLADPQASQVRDLLRAADGQIGEAETAFSKHYYRDALVDAQKAYDRAAEAARQVGVSTERSDSHMEEAARQGAAPQSDEEHHTGIGDFIDSLEPGGPRSQP
jgi:hypothetical protein